MQFKYQMQINELQLKLQLATSPEVCKQRETNLKSGMASISATLEDYGKSLDASMQIWNSLQEDPNVQKLHEEILQKKHQLEES